LGLLASALVSCGGSEEPRLASQPESRPEGKAAIELSVDKDFRHTGQSWFLAHVDTTELFPRTTIERSETHENGIEFVHSDGFSVDSLILQLNGDGVLPSGSRSYDFGTSDPDTGDFVPARDIYRFTGGSVRTNTRDWGPGSEVHVEFTVTLQVKDSPEIIRGAARLLEGESSASSEQREGIVPREGR